MNTHNAGRKLSLRHLTGNGSARGPSTRRQLDGITSDDESCGTGRGSGPGRRLWRRRRSGRRGRRWNPEGKDSQRPSAPGRQPGPDTTMVNAIELAIEERGGKAGNVKIEYESLDDATAQAGQWDEAKCAENAQTAAQDEEIVGW